MPAVRPLEAAANSTTGIPASAPPIIGRKSTSATQSAHSPGNGTPVASSEMKTVTPQITEVVKFPSMYPTTALLTWDATVVDLPGLPGREQGQEAAAQLRPSSRSSSTRTKIVNSSNSSDTAPSPNDSAGLARPCPNVTSLGAFFATHCCTW